MENSPANSSVNESMEDPTVTHKTNMFDLLGTPGSVASSSPGSTTKSNRRSARKRQSIGAIPSSASSSKSKKRRNSSVGVLSNASFGPSESEPVVEEANNANNHDNNDNNENDNIELGESDLPPLAGSPSPEKAPGIKGKRRSSTGGRRETAESSDLRELMATLQKTAGTPSTVATFHTGRDSLTSIASVNSEDFREDLPKQEAKKAKKSRKANRRLTADGADLENLLAGLDEEEEESQGSKVTFAPEPPPASPAASSPSNSMLMNDLSMASSNNSSDLSSRVPTPHAKMTSSSFEDKGEEEEEEDTLPPLPNSPAVRATRSSKRAASLGGGSGAAVPISILNKNKGKKGRASIGAMPTSSADVAPVAKTQGGKKRKSRKSVAFGSPQAAEFNNSSPSASLTPMPTKEAKEKYTIPDTSMSSMDTSNASSSLSNTLNEDADNTVELEGDLNALMTSISQGHGTNDADADENTVELEGDISALLKSADDTMNKGDDESEATDVPEEDRTMELETDMGSLLDIVSSGVKELRRLSDASGGALGSATKTSPTAHHVTLVKQSNPVDSSFDAMMAASENMAPVDLSTVKLDVCAKEIIGFCERDEAKSFNQTVHEVKSVLVEACNKAQTIAPPLMSLTSPAKKKMPQAYNSEIVVSTLYEVLSAASGEVAKKVEETQDGGSSVVENIKANNPDLLKSIQVGIRKHSNKEFQSQIRGLYGAVKECVIEEWKVWEGACAAALLTALQDRETDITQDLSEFAAKEKLLQEAFDSIKAVKGRAARKARRASLDRKQLKLGQMKDEVAELEEQLKALEEELQSSSEKASHAKVVAQHYVESQKARKEMASVSKECKAREKKYKTLEGLLMWSPVLVDSSKIIVDFSGGEMEETKVSLGFDLKSKAGIQVFMMEKKEKSKTKAKKSKGGGFSADAKKFASVKISALMDYVNNDLTVENGNEIPKILQNMEFQIGRIELIAEELNTIANVYDCVFEFDNSEDSIVITSDFVSRTQTAKLRSVFTLPDEEYPFTPMQACFESVIGGINTVHLGQSLARNVDPGYGYLRRAFDTVSAFLK